MPKINTDAGMPIKITLGPGTYYRCRCGTSRNLPFCDGTHQNSKELPLQFELFERKTVYLCSCGKTTEPPFCSSVCGVTHEK